MAAKKVTRCRNLAVISLFVMVLLILGQTTASGTGPKQSMTEEEDWGYVDVRPGAHMFWWLYYTSHPEGFTNRPWIIWLQGGPGYPSSGLGNFRMLGPLDERNNTRETTWVQEVSMLYIDNPVGVGFSYVDDDSLYVRTNEDIGLNLVALLKGFLTLHPEFKALPLYIFGQSYGGKMAPTFAYYLSKAIQSGDIECNLQGTGIGNGFVSPVDFISGYGTYLYQMSRLDLPAYEDITKKAQYFALAYERSGSEQIMNMTELLLAYNEVAKIAFSQPGLDLYDILHITPTEGREIWQKSLSIYENIEELKAFINGPIRNKLQIIPDNVQYDVRSQKVIWAIWGTSVLRGVVHMVDHLLTNTDVKVIVYSGQLDVICHTAGAMAWIQRLTWPELPNFIQADRVPMFNPETNQVETFVKSHDNLSFYWNLGSGHVVPVDVPEAALRMLRHILDSV